MQIKLNRPLAFFDLETTGLVIGLDRIIEISVLKLLPDGSRTTFTSRVNPEIPIPDLVINLTGITNEAVRDQPLFATIAPDLKIFLDDCDLAGYNSNKFDVPFLVDEFYRVNMELDISGRKLIDVQNIFHKMEQRTLAAAYKFYCEKELVNAHSAEADITATFEILEAQLERYQGQIENDVNFLHTFTNMFRTVDLAGRMVYNDKEEEIINFGKHKGKRVTDVFSAEPSYYDWLMKGDFARQTKAEFKRIKDRFEDAKKNPVRAIQPETDSDDENAIEKKLNELQQKFNKK